MKVQNSQPSFGRIVRDPSLSKETFQSIIKTPAVKEFAKNYSATISTEEFLSGRNPGKVQIGLRLTDIKPKNIFKAIKNKLFAETQYKSILVKTHAVDEKGLISSLSNNKISSIIKMLNNVE